MKRTYRLACTVVISAFTMAACIHPPSPASFDPIPAAYQRYLDAIDRARESIEHSGGVRATHRESDRRQGEAFLRAIVDASVTMALIDTPEFPVMALVPQPDARLGLNNPDNLYYASRFSAEHTYVLSGDRGLAKTFLIQVNRGLPGLTAEKGETVAHLTGHDLEVTDDGSFEIEMSPSRPARGQWLPLTPGADNLLVRFSFQDWEREHERPGSISISRRGASDDPLEITPEIAAAMLDDAATSIVEQASFYSRSFELMTAQGMNRMPGPFRASGGQATANHQWNFLGPFEFAPDEVLVITVKDAANAEYNNLEAANPWMVTFEFVHHQSSLNRSQVQVDRDGYIRYVVAPTDPGVPNWIDTQGETRGIVWSRWQQVHGELGPEYAPAIQIVKAEDLRSSLPPETPVITPEARRLALADRSRQLRERFRNAAPAMPEILRRLHAVEALVGQPLAMHGLDATIID